MRCEGLSFYTVSFKGYRKTGPSTANIYWQSVNNESDNAERKAAFGIDFGVLSAPVVLFHLDKKAGFKSPLGKNPRKTILNAVKSAGSVSKSGKDASVFDLADNPDMVLRIEHKTLENINKLPKDLVVVPIKYDNEVSEMRNLNLPLYTVVGKEELPSGVNYVLPDKVMAENGKILILKKASGEHLAQGYFNSISELMGIKSDKIDEAQWLNYTKFNDFLRSGDAIEFLEFCKDGRAFVPGLSDTEVFYKNYKIFVDDYLGTLSKIADMPQEAYNEAVSTIMSENRLNFRLDFYHPLNTFVDFDKNRFNFVDIQFDPRVLKYYDYRDPVAAFENVLLGCHCTKRTYMPSMLLVYPEDIERYTMIEEKILEKLEKARN